MEVKKEYDTASCSVGGSEEVVQAELNEIKTIVFTAVATTGWPTRADPASAKITSLCFLAIGINQLARNDARPNIMNKLTIYCNPEKEIHPKASEASGLTNEDLIDCPTFDQQARNLVEFMKNLPQPIRLVAHQGDIFHFKLLFLHLSRTIPVSELRGIFCTDSLRVAKAMAPQLRSKALDELHKLVGGQPIVGAEGRCQMLLDIIRALTSDQLEEFITLCKRIKCSFFETRFKDLENNLLGEGEIGRM
ncbi:hypothetical protein EGW08_005976 [Elysia chlorotica]|uniref:Exonuclease domain-containing protein n=1 Tax=Elysia chlorotica TaxID=188477 RepID=A0A3S1BL71_ELYCH|nr:hypothetical protein EGW08_005976 [Elysia chlorotica]